MSELVLPWRDVSPPEPINGGIHSLLATVDALRRAWEEGIKRASPEDFTTARIRTLRRHAIETGLIERLYDVSWGVTEALVAEGLTLEAAAHEGGITPDVLAMIRSQFEALEYLASVVRQGRDLSTYFVKEFHVAITQHQRTYEATDVLGRKVQAELHHGQWKTFPNHVRREDGRLLEYVPPEQVQPQIERLVDLYSELAREHPMLRAAWLHHRFINIHPFEDGNGRVGRALVLLVLLHANYAPLVVDRDHRADYIRALDLANDGDLGPLVRLFCELEIIALRSELQRPVETSQAAGAVSVAKAYAVRLRDLRVALEEKRKRAAEDLATAMHHKLVTTLKEKEQGLREAFATADPATWGSVQYAAPPDERATYFKRQLIRAAQAVNFRANLAHGTWWVRMHVTVLGQTLRYVAAIQKVGYQDSGVLAVTAFAELLPPRDGDQVAQAEATELLNLAPTDSVTLVAEDSLEQRWPEVEHLIERTLAAAVDEFGSRLG